MPAVEFCGIGKSFDGQIILREFDLPIETGQYVVLLGPSGCGKTTALRLIAGLECPDTGSLRIAGRDVKGISPSRRDVAMVFQGDSLYPHMTIRQSILYGLRGRAEKAEAAKRIVDATKMVAIESLLDRLPSQLSGGELRRASVVKAIARHASVRLLDEPLSAIDATAVHAIQEELLRWHRSSPGVTLHVTHDGNEAMRIADKIAVMDDGRVVQFDSPSEIYRRPSSINVAAAVGWPPMILLPAKCIDGCLIVGGAEKAAVRLPSLRGCDRDVVVGVRPDAWRFADHDLATENPSLVLQAKLTDLRQIDHRCMATFQYEGNQFSTMFDTANGLHLGQDHRIAASCDDLHLFDAEDGTRLGNETG